MGIKKYKQNNTVLDFDKFKEKTNTDFQNLKHETKDKLFEQYKELNKKISSHYKDLTNRIHNFEISILRSIRKEQEKTHDRLLEQKKELEKTEKSLKWNIVLGTSMVGGIITLFGILITAIMRFLQRKSYVV